MRSVPIALELHSCPTTEGTATLLDRSPPARVARAAIALVVCVVIACVCVFIPLLHFVLVPGFLVTGLVLSIVRLRDHCTLVEVRAACPRCKTPRVFEVKTRFSEGRTIHCDGCGNALALRARATASLTGEAPSVT